MHVIGFFSIKSTARSQKSKPDKSTQTSWFWRKGGMNGAWGYHNRERFGAMPPQVSTDRTSLAKVVTVFLSSTFLSVIIIPPPRKKTGSLRLFFKKSYKRYQNCIQKKQQLVRDPLFPQQTDLTRDIGFVLQLLWWTPSKRSSEMSLPPDKLERWDLTARRAGGGYFSWTWKNARIYIAPKSPRKKPLGPTVRRCWLFWASNAPQEQLEG